MSKFLRTTSTRRLLASIAGLLVAIAAGSAIAIAAAGPGPIPKREPLAQAIRQALGAHKLTGISGRISFTNHLIDASNLQGSDPILSGATGRFWLTQGHLRLELQSDNGDAQVVLNNGSFWVYDPSSNSVYEGRLPVGMGSQQSSGHASADKSALPSIAEIQRGVNKLAAHLVISGARPSDVAGQAAYTVRVAPRHDGGLLGAAELAWDAVRGVPLRIAIYASNQSSPVLELKATNISYGTVPLSDFKVSPPLGAKVVSIATPASHGASAADRRHRADRGREKGHAPVSGVAAVARKLPFKLVAPASVAGLPRHSVTLLDWGGHPAALVTYGQYLGGVAVIEQGAAPSASTIKPPSGDHAGLTLPTVSINGATGQELDTALGTLLRFTRGGVAYTVVGSVPPPAAEAAARAL